MSIDHGSVQSNGHKGCGEEVSQLHLGLQNFSLAVIIDLRV